MKKVLISCATHDAFLYIKALKQVHLTPILLKEIVKADDYDGLLLPGGGDIAPCFYQCKNKGSRNICISEDIIQLLMFHRFYEQKKPILGICKGMQLINVALGGTLTQTLSTEALHIWQNKDNYHKTSILPGSIIHSLYGSSIITNSAHHQAVLKPGSQLTASQYTFDGTIEAIEHNTLPILGVQWHPERMCESLHSADTAQGMSVFEWFAEVLKLS